MTLTASLGPDGWSAQIPQEGLYDWAAKPLPTDVPVGTEIRIRDFCYSTWVTDGTIWRPKNAFATLINKDLTGLSGAFPSTAAVTLAGSFVIPDDILNGPGVVFESYFAGRRVGTLSAAQSYVLSVGVDGSQGLLGTMTAAQTSSAVIRGYGNMPAATSGNGHSFQISAFHNTNPSGEIAGSTTPFSTLSGVPIKLFARNGSTDSSETWNFYYWRMTVRF